MLGFTFPSGTQKQGGLTQRDGRLVALHGVEALIQSIRMLLLTTPGERVMRPDFGCPLHRLCFEPNDATTAGLAIRMVEEAVARHEPRAEILALDARPDPARPDILLIDLQFRERSTGQEGALTLDHDLSGGPV